MARIRFEAGQTPVQDLIAAVNAETGERRAFDPGDEVHEVIHLG